MNSRRRSEWVKVTGSDALGLTMSCGTLLARDVLRRPWQTDVSLWKLFFLVCCLCFFFLNVLVVLVVVFLLCRRALCFTVTGVIV